MLRPPVRGLLLDRALGASAGRRLMVIAGVAASSMLVLVQLAAYRNVTGSVRTYVSQPGIDLWVAPRGTDNLVRSSGLIDAEVVQQLGRMPGVAAAHRILRVFVSVTPDHDPAAGSGRRPLHLLGIGYNSPAGLAGPPRFVAGRDPRGEHELALDRTAARKLGVGPGDRVQINQRRALVVGITGGTNLLATQFVFFDLEAAENATGFFGDASFVVLRLQPGRSAGQVQRHIQQQIEDVSAYPRATFVDNSVREAAAGFLPLLALIAGLGLAVTSVLVALLLQAAVEASRGQIAVLLAIGATPPRLALGVLRQSLALVLAGGGLGAALALGLGSLLYRLCSVVQLAFLVGDVALVLALFGLAGALAALTPLVRLSRIDPLEAFRR